MWRFYAKDNMKQYKQVILIYAVAVVVVVCGLFYLNASMNAIEIESDSVGAVRVSDTTTIPRLQVSETVIVGVESYQGGEDNGGRTLQSSTFKVQ